LGVGDGVGLGTGLNVGVGVAGGVLVQDIAGIDKLSNKAIASAVHRALLICSSSCLSPSYFSRHSTAKCRLVQAGIERARQQGKRIGQLPVTERDGFSQRFETVVERLEQGGISRRQAAGELAIGYATLKRLLDTRRPSEENKQRTLVAVTACSDGNDYDDIMATLLTKSLNSKP
jgi:hypothetical protein